MEVHTFHLEGPQPWNLGNQHGQRWDQFHPIPPKGLAKIWGTGILLPAVLGLFNDSLNFWCPLQDTEFQNIMTSWCLMMRLWTPPPLPQKGKWVRTFSGVFFFTLNSTLPSHLGQALSTARHLSVSDFAKRNVHKDTEWDSTSSWTRFCALRILTLQKWIRIAILRTWTPCYPGSNPSIGGSLGILRVAYFCGKKIRSFLPEMFVLRFWCKMNGKKTTNVKWW